MSSEFNSAIVYELTHMNLGQGELLYQQNETADKFYFIFTGRFKLHVDLNNFIDDKIFKEIMRREEIKQRVKQHGK
jgi:CRP-like cAMP-binding protein